MPPKQQGPLHGIRIVDLSRVLAGPFCTALLADLGADVIKIENPHGGDDARSFGPFKGDRSIYFALTNRNKRSICLDLKEQRDRVVLNKLVGRADVLVENFRPGVTERLGADYAAMSAINPRLIYLSISGFGQSGPLSSRPAFDTIVQAMSGLMAVTGAPGQGPTRVGESIADVMTGVYGAWAISTSLYARETTGRGIHLDLAMFDTLLSAQVTSLAQLFASGNAPRPVGNRHPVSTPFDTFVAADGVVVIGAATKPMFAALCQLMGRRELALEPRFASEADRTKHEPELKTIIEAWTSKLRVDEIIKACESVGIPVGPIWDLKAAAFSENARARQLIASVAHPHFGEMRYVPQPVRYGDYRPDVAPEPDLGADTRDILNEWLGE
jgi:formyl-CoA transferase/CoA:oxalate CoA-transferase